jgi:uncharacterized protein (TIGR00661 family)
MKVLYAIQGTGNGHISRARDIIPVLKQYGNVDILISGTQADVQLGYPVRYQLHGLSFIFGKRGGIDFFKTFRNLKFITLCKEIWKLNVFHYDLILNDFEPVSAWACLLKGKKCIGLSHQSAVIHPFSPKPQKNDLLGYLILKFYAPVSKAYGFHFKTYADKINLPIIRQEVRALTIQDGNFYIVYLPAYSDERIIHVLSKLNAKFKVFSKHSLNRREVGNVEIIPINNELYLQYLSTCKGVISGAGFEGPAEALFLKKKLLVIPMKGQYEQQCNAAALKKMGVTVLDALHLNYFQSLNEFLLQKETLAVNYPENTAEIIRKVIVDSVELSYPAAGSFSFS